MTMVTPGGDAFVKYAPQMKPAEPKYDRKMYDMLAGRSVRDIAGTMTTMGDVYGTN